MAARWLSIIGIGEDGRAGLKPTASALVDSAELVVGGRRHLALIGATPGEQLPWASPLEATIPTILVRRGRPVAVLASGDPFWFGVGATLARHISAGEMLVLPAPSTFSLAAARLGWTLQDTVTLGLHTAALPSILPHLHRGRRILAFTVDAATPGAVAGSIAAYGFGPSRMVVLEALGGPHERIRETTAGHFDLADIHPLNTLGIAVAAESNARPIPRAAGLDDDFFAHDGQLTKRAIRAIALSSLAPLPGQLLWDVGLGSGSVAIEWLLCHPANRAVGIERDPERAARAAHNAAALGVPHLAVKQGSAPAALAGLAEPDAVFIGGGCDSVLIETCWAALKPGGRMVVNAVTLETQALLADEHIRKGGSLSRLSIESAEAVGRRRGWRAAMPIVQWVGLKGAKS